MSVFTEERCKQIMEELGMVNSRSLYTALNQVANEVEQTIRMVQKIKDATEEVNVKFLASVVQNHSERLDALEDKDE